MCIRDSTYTHPAFTVRQSVFALRDAATGDALGGTTYWTATAEVRFPLPFIPDELGMSGAVFADAGSLFGAGQLAKVIAFALEAAGAPIVTGGAGNILEAFAKLITDHGGECRTGSDADEIVLDANGRAAGLRLAGGEMIMARQGVICSMTPAHRRIYAARRAIALKRFGETAKVFSASA